MKELFERCCGLDVHRDSIVACILTGYGKSAKKEIQTFSTNTFGLRLLSDWLKQNHVQDVVVESTGIYWKPLYTLFEADFNISLVNAYHVKNARGRKTDVKDCEWLCRLFKVGAINASFVPPKEIRRLRELVRLRLSLVRDRSRVKNRIIKTLECANIKLSSVFTNVFGYTSWLIVTKIINGERDLNKLTTYIHERVKTPKSEIQQALDGILEKEDLDILKLLISQVEGLEAHIEQCQTLIEQHLEPFKTEVELLETIPGISRITATAIISEIGVDMSAFPTDEKLASWSAMCPGHHESAGKQKSGRTRRGNNFLKAALIQAAWASSRVKNSYLQSKYRQMTMRKGTKRAAIAIGHKILIVIYHLISKKTAYNELGARFLDGLQTKRKVKYHVKRLEELGYHIHSVEKVKEKEQVFID